MESPNFIIPSKLDIRDHKLPLFSHSDPSHNIISNDKFNELVELNEQNNLKDELKYNYCPDCLLPMDIIISGYECNSCGYSVQLEGSDKDISEDTTSILRLDRCNKRNAIYLTSGNIQTRRKQILDQLMQKNERFTGKKIPQNILMQVANTYSEIQKIVITDDSRKFVKRGSIKDEILGVFIKYECDKQGIPRKNKDIATMMECPTGLSNGIKILRDIKLNQNIDLPIDFESKDSFVSRYLETLNIDCYEYRNFIYDIINESFKKKIGMNSIHSSKIVGTIWILICHKNLNIPHATLELAADNIRKNTWIRFSKEIESNILKFIDIFNKWNIPHGIKQKIIKKTDFIEFTKKYNLTNYSISSNLSF